MESMKRALKTRRPKVTPSEALGRRRPARADRLASPTPAPRHGGRGLEQAGGMAADQIVLEIRRFIAASIFLNARAAEQVGLGLTDLQLLHLLQLHGPSTPGELAAGSGLSSGGVTVALDRLAAAGYLRREPNPADRRSHLVTLLPRRLRRLEAMYSRVEAETRRMLATLSQSDLEATVRFFRALGGVRASTT